MTEIKTCKGLIEKYDQCPENVKWYFDQVPRLLPDFPYEVTLAYLFFRTERAHNYALYCGAVKLHKANGELARKAISDQHITRESFLKFYNAIYGHKLSQQARDTIKSAEATRDLVIHGKEVPPARLRAAIAHVFDYSALFNEELTKIAGIAPFGPLQGFKGRTTLLDKNTSRWILKGMGFDIA